MNIMIFAGTIEGRKLAEFLSIGKLYAIICVATEYGELSLPDLPNITVHRGRLTAMQMAEYMSSDTLVVDATHPYADIVTANIRQACEEVGAEYIRLLRPKIVTHQPIVTVRDAAAAAAYLNTVTGSVLLTTGSKELEAFTAVHRYAERLYPRVLPVVDVIQKCMELGFPGRSVIAMQGPFSYEINVALLRQIRAKYLVTKDSGAAGGFSEKLRAAASTGTTVILISRPTEEQGKTLAEIKMLLKSRFSCLRQTDSTSRPFPLFVSLRGRRVLVVGGGWIARRRVGVLRNFGAEVVLVAPEVKDDLDLTTVLHCCRSYEKSDVSGAFLVVAATDNRCLNRQIARDCSAAGILCSVADSAAESTFFFPAICARGNLTAGVVSDGSDHAATARAAERIRSVLQEESTDAKS